MQLGICREKEVMENQPCGTAFAVVCPGYWMEYVCGLHYTNNTKFLYQLSCEDPRGEEAPAVPGRCDAEDDDLLMKEGGWWSSFFSTLFGFL